MERRVRPVTGRADVSVLRAAGVLSASVALLHLVVIFVGAPAYRYFGAGAEMARLDERGSPMPAVVSAGLTLLFGAQTDGPG